MAGRGRGRGNKPPPFLSPSSSFPSSSFSKRSRSVGRVPSSLPKPPPAPPILRRSVKTRKKAPARLWMRLDRRGGCEMFMCDKAFVAERSGLRTRDLRIVGPLLSRFPRILAREKAMVLNLEFVRAIVTADEVLLLEPLAQEVLPFVDKLRRQFPLKSLEEDVDAATATHADNLQDDNKHSETGSGCEAPFEFQVLELALEAVCLSFDSSVTDLNRHAVYVLEDLTNNVSTRNLERVRSLKRSLTCLLAGVHKVRAEVEHLLDDSENMAQLHLSRKLKNGHHHEALLASSAASNTRFPSETSMVRPGSHIKQSTAVAMSTPFNSDAGNLEMLLEDYFIQLDEIRSRVVLARGYIVDTEDCLNIQLDNQRNELLRFRLTMIISSFGIALNTLMVASFGMNMPFGINRPHSGDGNTAVGSFWPLVGAMSSFCLLFTIILFGHAWRNRLLGS